MHAVHVRSVLSKSLSTAQRAAASGFAPKALASLLVMGLAPAVAHAASLVPHRAVYEITLERAKVGSGIGQLRGRMVYELTGNACEGYTQNMRFVSRMVSPQGEATVSDMRTSSWEQGEGQRFRFNSRQYRDDKLAQSTKGDARRRRKDKSINIRLSSPRKAKLALRPDVFFPVQHSIALLNAARAGRKVLQADLYDGSEKGDKVYATTSVIGLPLAPDADAKLPAAKNGKVLRGLAAWPVSISYFEKDKANADGVPVYELAFRYYDNGVSRKLFIDYGEFSIRGRLSQITFLKRGACAKP
ncbi:MAG: cell envelope integrity EipB family protein [Pseudomonadota bacterium]